jgi:hypothetical protein
MEHLARRSTVRGRAGRTAGAELPLPSKQRQIYVDSPPMQKTLIRCYRGVALGAEDRPEEVAFMFPDFGDAPRLYSCVVCGTLFVAHVEDERHTGVSLSSRIAKIGCPQCESPLALHCSRIRGRFGRATAHLVTLNLIASIRRTPKASRKKYGTFIPDYPLVV